MVSARELSADETTPQFRIVLPDGWVRYAPGTDKESELLDLAGSRLMTAGRPDLFAQLRHLTGQAFQSMRESDVVAVFTPGPDTPTALFLPVSITAAIRRAPDAHSWDSTVTQLIRQQGATALGGDKRFVTWRSDSVRRIAGDAVPVTTASYLTPVPATRRSHALLFTLVVPRPPDADADIPAAAIALGEACISTLVWESTS
ncbi:MAG: hypothetical protein KAG80_02745 [Nocardioides sp.]|nr:hypothetical protein [Nocardioides sp.]